MENTDLNNFVKSTSKNNYELKLYLDEFVEKIRNKILKGEMNAETIRQNPILITLLKDRKISKIFNKKIDVQYNFEENGRKLLSISNQKLVTYINNNEEFLKLCARYGKFLDCAKIMIHQDASIEDIENSILKQMIQSIDLDSVKNNSDLKLTFEKLFDFIKKNGKKMTIDMYKSSTIYNLIEKVGKENALELAINYGRYLNDVDPAVFANEKGLDKIIKIAEENIEANIKNRVTKYDEDAPKFFRNKYPQFFISEYAPNELKMHFYGAMFKPINFIENAEWLKFLEGKNLKLAISEEYVDVYNKIRQKDFIRLCMKHMKIVKQMIDSGNGDILADWYKATDCKFVPSEEVMVNFPENEINRFLSNGKKWSKLVKMQEGDRKKCYQKALLKMAYCMGVFHGSDEGFKQVVSWMSDLPKKLSSNEYEKIIFELEKNPNKKTLFCQLYKLGNNSEYTLHVNEKRDKEKVQNVRGILEDLKFPRILTAQKMYDIFDSFEMNYDPKFANFLTENMDEILQDTENQKWINIFQKQFDEILFQTKNISYDLLKDYKKNIPYDNVDIGNEELAKQASMVKYSQINFEELQNLYNEGEKREFSSIPQINGTKNGYTYEMLRADNPAPLTIGRTTDTCIELHDNARSCMKHSVLSSNGRLFFVYDNNKRIVAHSWFWRNQYVGCFDSIEVPKKIFKIYENEYLHFDKTNFLKNIIEVYNQASQDLMQKDEQKYQKLLSNGEITNEQYDGLVFKKITVGLGWDEVAETIKTDESLKKDEDVTFARMEPGFENLYSKDSKIQYILQQKPEIKKSNYDNLNIYEDDIQIYDEKNMNYTVLLKMRRMENAIGRDRLSWIMNNKQNQGSSKTLQIIRNIASEYGFETSKTKVIATPRMAIIYSKNKEQIKIGDIFTAPIKDNLPEEKKKVAQNHLIYQIKKALKQIGVKSDNYSVCQLAQEPEMLFAQAMFELDKQEKNINSSEWIL